MAQKKNKALTYILLSIPLLVGGYFLFKKKGSGKTEEPKKGDDVITTGGGTTGGTTTVPVFPLKRGSKGAKVIELQRAILAYDATLLPRFKDDGDFGSETEAAVNSLLGKRTVDSQSDIDRIKNMAKTPISGSQNAFSSASGLVVKALQAKQTPKVTLIRDSYVLTGKIDPFLIGGNKFDFNPVYVLKKVGFSFSPIRYGVNAKSGYVDMGDFLGNAISVNPNDIKVS